MPNIDTLKKQFQSLSFEGKKEKLIAIFEDLKGTNPVFDEVLEALYNNPRMNDEFLVASYGDVMTLAGNVETLGNANRVEEMGSNLQKNMKVIREKEAQDRSQENADEVLDDAFGSSPDKKPNFLKRFFSAIARLFKPSKNAN